jgi:peptidoglycan/xylan/chitin deacetylase (PgdA/CDA1 family)
MTGPDRPGANGSLPRIIRDAFIELATSSSARKMLRPLMNDRVAIFMLHRFADAERGTGGHDPALLRETLQLLRKERIPVLPLRDVVAGLMRDQPLQGVVFTVDDGYDDFATVGAPVFAEFDCPVTVFPTTGFLDRLYWYWWDRIEYAVLRSTRTEVGVPASERILPLRTPADRVVACDVLDAGINGLPQHRRPAAMDALLTELAVELPAEAPPQYQPLSWDTARRLTATGLVDFGPHTVNHPHIASLPIADVEAEMRGCWIRLNEELADPVPVFCYPYGRSWDVSDHVASVAGGVGFEAALTSIPGYAARVDLTGDEIFHLARFAMPPRLSDVRQVAFGLERLKSKVRAAVRLRPKTR